MLPAAQLAGAAMRWTCFRSKYWLSVPRNHHDGASAFLPVPHPKMDRPTGRIAPSNSDGHLYHLFRPVSLANAVHFILPPTTEPHPLEEVLIFPNRVIAAVCKVQLEPSLTTKTSHSIRGADMEIDVQRHLHWTRRCKRPAQGCSMWVETVQTTNRSKIPQLLHGPPPQLLFFLWESNRAVR